MSDRTVPRTHPSAGTPDVKALAFDVFGTLVDWRSGIAEAFRASGLATNPETLADAWRARFWPLVLAVNSGARAWANFEELHAVALAELASDTGLEITSEQQVELVRGWRRLNPWPDARAGLEELRRDRVVVALSNAHVPLLVALARHADLRFDCLISAEVTQLYKPARQVYETAVRTLGLDDPAELMLVASHPLDLEGARRAGLRTALIERPLERGPGSGTPVTSSAEVTVSDLRDLAGSLGRRFPCEAP